MKNSLILYHAYSEHFELLTDEELGQLLRAIMLYDATGEVTELSGMAKMAFSFIKKDLDISREKYVAKCEKNRENGERGGRGNKKETEPKKSERFTGKAKKSERFSEKPKKADNDNEHDNENENESAVADDNARKEASGSSGEKKDQTAPATAAFTELLELYKQNIHPAPGSLTVEKIADWLLDVDASLIRYAIEQAVAHEKRNWAYIHKIIESHYASGRKTQAEAERAAPKSGRRQPEEKPPKYDFDALQKQAFAAVNGLGEGDKDG